MGGNLKPPINTDSSIRYSDRGHSAHWERADIIRIRWLSFLKASRPLNLRNAHGMALIE